MDKLVAEKVKAQCEAAIRELSSILIIDKVQQECSQEEFEAIRRGVGSSLAGIDTDLLAIVNRQFPEIDPVQ